MPVNAWDHYSNSPESHFARFEYFRFSNVHRSFMPFLPQPGGICLDVGAGSGRDAAALVRKGLTVVAVEPNLALLKLAQQKHDCENLFWISDSLPHLKKVIRRNEKYDFILLSAVWMHLRPNQHMKALQVLSSLLSNGGFLALTLRVGAKEPDRFIHEVSVEDVLRRCTSARLLPVYISRANRDLLNRSEVRWVKIVLKKSSGESTVPM